MQLKIKLIIYIWALLVSTHLSFAQLRPLGAKARIQTTYYIDGFQGNDANSGRSAEHAWRHLSKLSQIDLKPGDSVLLKRGTVFFENLNIQAQGTAALPIVFDTYGKGNKPQIIAPDHALYTIEIKNSDYITLQDLEIVNKGSVRLAGRTGVKLLCQDYGVSHRLTLRGLYVHDVNGSLIKSKGGGSGIQIENKWRNKISIFDSLLIEDCVIRRTARNGIIWNAPYKRDNWHPNTHIVVRKNLLEGVPGDGIVPIGCDSALIEYNVMRDCPEILPSSEAAAGIWPWSCDNTLIQFNEVSGQKNQWDAQGFDADYNCTNTTIQYNYSHDNYGGMVLICNDGGSQYPYNIGNIGSVVRYNLSINDGIRPKPARSGKMFSPSIHVAGPVQNTVIEHNIIIQCPVTSALIDRTMLEADSWNGFADSTIIKKNLFFASGVSSFKMNHSTRNYFWGNYYIGNYQNLPFVSGSRRSYNYYQENLTTPFSNGFNKIQHLLIIKTVGNGSAFGHFINKAAMMDFQHNTLKY